MFAKMEYIKSILTDLFDKQRANYFWRSQGYNKTGNCVFQKLFTAELAYVLSCLLERLREEEEAGWEAKQTSKKEELGEEEQGEGVGGGEGKGDAENKQAKRSTTHKHTGTGSE